MRACQPDGFPGWGREARNHMEMNFSRKNEFGILRPIARSEDLVIEEVGDELLVYDLSNDGAHCLGAAAARVWRACDGKTAAASLEAKLGLDSETVSGALQQLEECSLLESDAEAGM